MKKRRRSLSVVIPSFNVEEIIKKCIQSVSWAEEILVVDSFSTDKTREIAESLSARILTHKYEYSARQKNWAIPQASHEWVLLLDTDEVVTPELSEEIIYLLGNDEIENFDGFKIARKEYFLGKWMRWGGRYPLYNIRLFRKTCLYENRDVHAHIIIPKNRTQVLRNDILHFSNPSLEHFFKKSNRYSTYQANYMKKQIDVRKKVSLKKLFSHTTYLKSVIKDYWFFIPFAPAARFFYMYIFRFGFLDGRYGFMLAVFYGFQDYVSKTKYYQLRGKKAKIRSVVQKTINRLLHIGQA